MTKIIMIEMELPDDDPGRFGDVLNLLDTALPYMADNVIVTSRDGGNA